MVAAADLQEQDREQVAAGIDGLAPLSRPEAVLLVRFVAAKMALDWLRPWFWVKYGVVVVGVVLAAALWYMDDAGSAEVGAIVVLALVVAAILSVAQRLVTRVIRRLGAHHRLDGLEPIYDDFVDWRGQLRKGIRRLGSPWKLLRAARRGELRHNDDLASVADGEVVLDWRTSIPLADLREARSILARGADRSDLR